MQWRPVDSTVVTTIGYDPESRVLALRLTNGRAYRYFDVPEILYRRLLVADSIGRLYNAEVRDHYQCERIEQP